MMATPMPILCCCVWLVVVGAVASALPFGQFTAALSSKKKTEEKVASLTAQVAAAREKVSSIRGKEYDSKVNMGQDDRALAAIAELQEASRQLILAKYGATARGTDSRGTTFIVSLSVIYPEEMDAPHSGVIEIETAPIELLPHSVLTFMDMAKGSLNSAFYRNAGHVLQINADGYPGLAFQEYSDKYPHVKGTLGFAGRPGGPQFYISTIDNSEAHGPGSQGSKMGEADTCFARVFKGKEVVDRLFKEWGQPDKGFNRDAEGFMTDEWQHAPVVLSLGPVSFGEL